MSANKIFSRFGDLVDIAATRAAAVWVRLNADGSVSERTAAETVADLGLEGAVTNDALAAETAARVAAITPLQTKLAGIEDNATADQTGVEIKALLEALADTNFLTDLEQGNIRTLEQLQDAVGAMFQSGTHTGCTVAYNDAGGTVDITVTGGGGGGGPLTQEEVEDMVANLITQGTGINVNYDDANNTLTISLSGESFTTAEKNKLINVPADTNNALASKQPLADNLTAEASLTGAADRLSYFTGVGAKALAVFTGYGRTLLSLADKAALKTELDLTGTNSGDQDLSALQLKPTEGAFVDGDKTKLDNAIQPASIPTALRSNYLGHATLTSTAGTATLDTLANVNGTLSLTEDTALALSNIASGVTGNVWVTNPAGWVLSLAAGIVDEGAVADITAMAATDLAQLTYVYTPNGKLIWRIAVITGGNA